MSDINHYRDTGISFAFKKVQPDIFLFACPVCGVKHEREGNPISFERSLCDKHYRLYKPRQSALTALAPWDRPNNQAEYDDMYDHVKWLKISEGIPL